MITDSLWIFHIFIIQWSILGYIQSLGFVVAAISCRLLTFLQLTLSFHAYYFLAYAFDN